MHEFRLGASNRRTELYPHFPDEEFESRWESIEKLMDRDGLDALVVHGDAGFHQPFVRYITGYDPPFLTYLVAFADPVEHPTLFVGLSNHLQYVREVAIVEDVRTSIPHPGRKLAERLAAGVGDGATVGLVGIDPRYDAGMPYAHHRVLSGSLEATLRDATAPVTQLVATHSDRELERVRRASSALDAAMESLADGGRPGMSEGALRSLLVEGATHDGGSTGVVFLSTAPMVDAAPGEPLPWKASPADREVTTGDVVTTEVSAHHQGYATQIHRPFAVGTAPTATYGDLFDVATDAYERMVDVVAPGNGPAEVHEALAPVENSPFKSYDVSLHGYGRGYLHPFVGTERSNYWPGADDSLTEDWTFEPGQVLVVQPNVVTEDERCGLQLGTTLVVTEDGARNLQKFPVQFGRL